MALRSSVVSARTRNRWKLVGIGILAAAPVVASYLLYWYWTPDQHTNYGMLLEPHPLAPIEVRTLDERPFDLAGLRGRWILLATDDLEGTFERVQATDAEVIQEPMQQPYGARDCAFRDPSGNLVRIAQA